MIECVVNISEGTDDSVIAALAQAAGAALLDLHRDGDHNRSVFTLVGADAVRSVARVAVDQIDLRRHQGVHPRIGVVDVVPFVALSGSSRDDALAARDAYAIWSAAELAVPCFLYGPERTLPDVRRHAFVDLAPDSGPSEPHPSAGATAVGQRSPMIAYNLWLAESDLDLARRLARQVRSPAVRALGLQVGDQVQVSMNLIDLDEVGPSRVFDAVARHADVDRAELVGLVPRAVLDATPQHRWTELDLAEDRTIETRCEDRGLDWS